jgi:hypothetical protein
MLEHRQVDEGRTILARLAPDYFDRLNPEGLGFKVSLELLAQVA